MTGVKLHDEELALLRAVCAEPEDDTPRLVLADWYDEQDDRLFAAFAAFIRQSVADARTEFTGVCDPDKDSFWFAGTSPWRNERAEMLLVSGLPNSTNNNGNLWAERLIGPGHSRGWCQPARWDRGFPAVIKFPSMLAWKRAAYVTAMPANAIYLRVPVVRTVVAGRFPSVYPFERQFVQRLALVHQQAYTWHWIDSDVHSGFRDPGNITKAVHKYLPNSNRYHTEQEALAAVELAFTDAGRVACGLPPRHFKAVSPTSKGT